jgi:hypothetical protein
MKVALCMSVFVWRARNMLILSASNAPGFSASMKLIVKISNLIISVCPHGHAETPGMVGMATPKSN